MNNTKTKRRQSLALLFDDAMKHYNNGDMQRCITCCNVILSNDETDEQAWNLLGLAFFATGAVEQSLNVLNKAFMLSHKEEYLINIAEILRRCNKLDEALHIMQSIHNKDMTDYYFNLAKIYNDKNDITNAKLCYEKVLLHNNNDKDALFNLANLLVDSDTERAEEYYTQSYQLGLIEAGINLASLLAKKDCIKDSLALYKELAKHAKNASFFFNYANTLAKASYSCKEKLKLCKQYYKKALELEDSPLFAINYSHVLLRFGEIKEGFKLAESRLSLDIMPKHVQSCYYKHEDNLKEKRLLIYHEQGLGDTIIFARFIPQLAHKAKSVIVAVQPPLIELFQSGFLGITDIPNVTLISHIPDDGFDTAVALPSLPYILKSSNLITQNVSAPKPQSNITKIGICYASNPLNPTHHMRSIDVSLLLNAIPKNQYDIFCLQYNPSTEQKAIMQEHHVKNLDDEIQSFADIYKALHNIDVLISIDTANVHLAATIGIRTIVLLPKYYDWRYGLGTSNLLYHANLQCLIQKSLNSWDEPLSQLTSLLSTNPCAMP